MTAVIKGALAVALDAGPDAEDTYIWLARQIEAGARRAPQGGEQQ